MTPQRREPGIRRRLRVPWVRDTFREKAALEANRPPHPDAYPTEYRGFWKSLNALSKASLSCGTPGHCTTRYSAADRRREKAVPA